MKKIDITLIKLTLASIWFGTAFVVIFCFPLESSLDLVYRTGLHGEFAKWALIAGTGIDIVFGVCSLTGHKRWLWRLQFVVIIVYSIIISVFLPEFWVHPFSPILKNIAILMLLVLLDKYGQENS